MKDGKRYSWGVLVTENSWGYREKEIQPKVKGVRRVMVLGDSFTEGTGLLNEQRYTDLLQKRLNAESTPSARNWAPIKIPPYEVLNFGKSGEDTVAERDELFKYGPEVKPDLIVVGFCFNDMSQLYYGPERVNFEKKYGHIINPISKTLYDVGLHMVAKTWRELLFKGLEIIGVLPDWREALDKMYQSDSEEWKKFVAALGEIKAYSDKAKLPAPVFAILNHGMYRDRPARYKNPDKRLLQNLKWCHQAEAAAKEIGYTTLNFESEIASKLDDKILAVNKYDNHPSAELHALYAEKLETFIRDAFKKAS